MNDGSTEAAGRPGRAERRRREHTDRVLDAATRLFGEQGFTETSMAAIADAADVSVGTLYNLFDNKEALYEELVRDKAELFRERLIAALESSVSREQAFERFVEELLGLFRREAASIRLYYRVSAQARISFRASLSGALRDRLEETMTAFARVIDGDEPGAAHAPSAAASRTATVCQAMLNELFMLHLDDPHTHPADEVLADAHRLVRAAVTGVPAPRRDSAVRGPREASRDARAKAQPFDSVPRREDVPARTRRAPRLTRSKP